MKSLENQVNCNLSKVGLKGPIMALGIYELVLSKSEGEKLLFINALFVKDAYWMKLLPHK